MNGMIPSYETESTMFFRALAFLGAGPCETVSANRNRKRIPKRKYILNGCTQCKGEDRLNQRRQTRF